MAKAQGKNGNTHGTRRAAKTAEQMAAIRWLAMKIEQVSIEVLVTDRDKFDAVEASLRDEVNRLKRIGRPEGIAAEDCPDGYVLCDGLCAPMCDSNNTVEAEASRPSPKPKR